MPATSAEAEMLGEEGDADVLGIERVARHLGARRRCAASTDSASARSRRRRRRTRSCGAPQGQARRLWRLAPAAASDGSTDRERCVIGGPCPCAAGCAMDGGAEMTMDRSLAGCAATTRRRGLAEADALADPIAQFERWFDDARRAGLHEPNAMTLATVDAAGQPAARMVLLKGVDARGLDLLHQPRQPQGQGARGQSQGGAGVLVGPAAAPGALRGHHRGRSTRPRRTPTSRAGRGAASSPPGRRRRAA